MIKWNKVTWYSWTLAVIIFFVVVPFLTWYFLKEYKEISSISSVAGVSIKHTDQIGAYKKLSDGTDCTSYDNYFVITKPIDGEVGSKILIKYKTSKSEQIACKYVVEKGDFEIDGSEATYFLTLLKNFIFLDTGTAPSPRIISAYDLNTRKKVFSDSYSSEIDISNNDSTIYYWRQSNVRITKINCPNLYESYVANGYGAVVQNYITVNLSDFKKVNTGEFRCEYQE